MRVAVLKESRQRERRVALDPSVVGSLVGAGHEIVVQAGAGVTAGFPDSGYRDAGASIVDDAAGVVSGSDIVVGVQPPPTAALEHGSVLISFLDPMGDLDTIRALAGAGVTSMAMELVPRITRAQKMDALSSQATVAGYRAALIGASSLGRFLPMLMTAAGTIRPSRVLVLGAGVAGLQAIATSRRLGAVVSAFDVRPAVKEQVQSLGATFLEAELDEGAEDAGGYAKELSEEQHQQELDLIAGHIANMDVVITTAQIPGRPAPVLVTEAMVESMKPGSVIVDLASESGGNCVLSRPGETVEHAGILVLGPVNLPSSLPVHASEMYARNILAFLGHLAPEGELTLDFDDEITAGACVTHGGEVVHPRVRAHMGLPELELAPSPTPDPGS